MLRFDEAEAATTMSLSIHFMIFAHSETIRPYSSAVFCAICHQPSGSLPTHQNLMSCGSSKPLARRRSLIVVPPRMLQYSTWPQAPFRSREATLVAIIGSMPVLRHHWTNSSVPIWLVSVTKRDSSSRRGRWSFGPTPSSQV